MRAPAAECSRRHFAESEIKRLARSIRETGFRGVVEVRRDPQEEGNFILLYGHMRKRAAIAAGLSSIPGIVVQEEKLQSSKTSFFENFSRTDISRIAMALELQALKEDYEISTGQLSSMTGISKTEMGHLFKLLLLPETVQDFIEEGKLSFGVAKLLTKYTKDDGKRDFISQCAELSVENSWTVKEMTQYLKKSERLERAGEGVASPPNLPQIPEEQLQAFNEALTSKFETVVNIKENKDQSGNIVLKYASRADLERLLKQLQA